MNKIYVGQTDLTIELTTNKNITGATSTKVLYKKPDGVLGEFDAAIKDPVLGIIEFVVSNALEINLAGNWTIWAKIVDQQGLVSIGESSKFICYNQGD